ncbi:fasciclin domain-containing protein [Pontibacter actiniarum]|uniref:FAS1 domain-containing protein n=1 Tax=Pontibacter actiniarum TaxID=323450 RepID=A0A1X9YTU7_9BACT|nr:fasciclin domain-containing protein [Pontibacter actiniarum]ARS36305.1 hypothetical protein CA264_13145 [Pontibacter actiniarum]
MKKAKICTAALAAATLLWGCAGSDTNTAVNSGDGTVSESVEQRITNDKPGSQAPMDPDTDMSAEDTNNSNISADNQAGRDMNIVALVQQHPDLSTFLELIQAADMVTVLESPAPYTVFAPTNQAFAALPAGTVEALKQPGNKMELRRILQAHVLPNRITTNEMQPNMPMKTAQGEQLVVTRQGQNIKVGEAMIVAPDVEASNGVVHVVNQVLLPPKK